MSAKQAAAQKAAAKRHQLVDDVASLWVAVQKIMELSCHDEDV